MITQNLSKADIIRNSISSDCRIGLTEFTRSKKWRNDLHNHDVIEIVDHTETVGFLISPEGMHSLAASFDKLEEEIERAQIDALFANRQDLGDWSSGKELAQKAKGSLKMRTEAVRELLDGN